MPSDERKPTDAVILSGARTPIGKFMGALASVPAPRLQSQQLIQSSEGHLKSSIIVAGVMNVGAIARHSWAKQSAGS